MIIQTHEPHIRISYDKIPYIRNPDPKDRVYAYNMQCEAVDIPESWVPDMLFIEKMPGILEPGEVYPENGDVIWAYIISLFPHPETEERVMITFKNSKIALAHLRALKSGTEINLKESFPEIFL